MPQTDSLRLNADSIMADVFGYTQRYGLRTSDFVSEIYVRHTLHTRRRNVLMRYIPGFFRMERGDRRYFGETLSRYQFHPPGEIAKKDIAAFSTMPYLRPSDDVWIGRYSLSVYEPNLFTDRILSPLNRRNRRFYSYAPRYSYTADGHLIVNIAIRPRISNTQLVRGNIDVDTYTGRVCAFSFSFTYGWAHLAVSGEMGAEGQASLFPDKIALSSRLKLFGNRIEETFEAASRYTFTSGQDSIGTSEKAGAREHRFDLTRQYLLRTDTTNIIRERAFFDRQRPFPLLDAQRGIYEKADSIRASAAETETRPTEHRRFISQRTEDFLLDSHTFGFGTQSRIKLPPLLTPSMLQWSRSKGFSLQARFTFHQKIDKDREAAFLPRIGYNFKQKQVYWQLPLTIDALPGHGGQFSIVAAGGDHMYNSRQADEVKDRLTGISNYDSIINVFDSYAFHYYRDNHVLANFRLFPLPGLEVEAGMRFHRRTLLNWNSVAASNGMQRVLNSLAPRVHVVWTPALYYYRNGQKIVPLRSQWPTFMLDYERGLRSFNDETHYERIEFDAKYTLPLYALRKLYFRAGAGFYTIRGNDCFFDYDYFRNSYLPTGWDDELSGQFQLLDSRWYNESRHYFRVSAAYESPMLLFSRLRFLTRAVQKERLYANVLNVGTLGYYAEWGYGVSTTLIDVAGFVAVAGQRQTGIGIKFVLRLFED